MIDTHPHNTRSCSEKGKHSSEEHNTDAGKIPFPNTPGHAHIRHSYLDSVLHFRPSTATPEGLEAPLTSTAEEKVDRKRVKEKAQEREELGLKAGRSTENLSLIEWKSGNKMKNTGKPGWFNWRMVVWNELRQEEELRAVEAEAWKSSKKKQLILQMLQKLDDQMDPEAYLATFETSMAEDNFTEEEWPTILRKALSVYQELDRAIPYQTLKYTLLERLDYRWQS